MSFDGVCFLILLVIFVPWAHWVGQRDERDWWRLELRHRGIVFTAPNKEKKALYWRDGGKKCR